MALSIPTIQSRYVQAAMLDANVLGKLRAAGVVTASPLGDVFEPGITAGDRVSIPEFTVVDGLAHADIVTNAALEASEIDQLSDVAVVLRDAKSYKTKEHDIMRSGESIDKEISRQIGALVAKRLAQQLLRVARAAIDAIDTPSAGCHVHDVYTDGTGAPLTAAAILAAKFKMGDAADEIDTCVLNSVASQSLINDLITTYKVGGLGDAVLRSGQTGEILGIRNWVITDLLTAASTGKYETLLFGQGAMFLGFQMPDELETWEDKSKPSTEYFTKVTMDYIAHLRGLKWNSETDNPTDANLADNSLWDEAYNDHRTVKALKIVHDATT